MAKPNRKTSIQSGKMSMLNVCEPMEAQHINSCGTEFVSGSLKQKIKYDVANLDGVVPDVLQDIVKEESCQFVNKAFKIIEEKSEKFVSQSIEEILGSFQIEQLIIEEKIHDHQSELVIIHDKNYGLFTSDSLKQWNIQPVDDFDN